MGSTVLLNQRKVTSGMFTASEKADIDKDKRLSRAFIGYSKFDVLSNQKHMTYRRWNDRDLITMQVNKLVTSFMVDGVHRFKVSNAIPLAIKKENLKPGSYGPDGNAMEGLKYLEFILESLEKGGDDPIIYVASGQHRIAALEQYQAFLKKAKQESLKGLRSLEKKPIADVDDMEIEEENRIAKPRCDEIEGSIAFGGEWIVAIYDLGEYMWFISTHICANHVLHDLRNIDTHISLHTIERHRYAHIIYITMCADRCIYDHTHIMTCCICTGLYANAVILLSR